jgi:hypothetical protein
LGQCGPWNKGKEGSTPARLAELGNGKRAREENSWAAQDNKKGRKGKEPWADFEDSAQEVARNRNPLLFSNSFIN